MTKENDNGQSIAEDLVKWSKVFDDAKKKTEGLKTDIRKFPETTFTTEDGSTVSVGKNNKERISGTKLVFSEEAFLSLSEEDQKEILEKQVATYEPNVIKATAAKVAVKYPKKK